MPRPRVLVLLPPSEGKAPGGRGPVWDPDAGAFGAVLGERRRALLAALPGVVDDGSLAVSVGGTEAHRQAAVQRALRVGQAPTRRAVDRYTGVLYAAFGPAALTGPARRRALGAVVVSGLAGLVTLADRLPDYTLPIGVALGPVGRLASWWRPVVSPVLDRHVEGAVVWDLLPGAHAAVWFDGGAHRSRHRVRVLQEGSDGARTTVSHDNKSTKGLLARRLAEEPVRDPGELAEWAVAQGLSLEIGETVDLVRRRR